jgi:hypothetical protein
MDTVGVSTKKKAAAITSGFADLSTLEAVVRFREAAAEFTKKATRTRESAMKVLVESGIYTKSGKLTKNYRP